MKHVLFMAILIMLSGCADSMRNASRMLKTTNEFQTKDMTWMLSFNTIYFGGEIVGKEKSVLHNVKSVEACQSFNDNELLSEMVSSGLLPKRINCLPFNGQKKVSEGLFIKQTSDLSVIRQDYYYVDHLDMASGHIIKRQDIIQADYNEYSNIWLFNSIIPLITASRQSYGNDVEWKEKMDLICEKSESKYCNS